MAGEGWDDETYPDGPPDKVTEETIIGGGDSGMGTLNNSQDNPPSNDIYLKLGRPSVDQQTYDLMQLVLADGDGVSISLKS